MTVSNPLKWHGGKSYLADWIISHMPDHTHYVEPYFGGGAVLFRKDPEGVSEVANDIHLELTNFWLCLQCKDRCEDLIHLLSMTPFSEVQFTLAEFGGPFVDNPLRARDFFVRYRQSRQGLGKDFATLSRNRTRRGMNEQVSSWLSAIEGLQAAHERLSRVVILNKDALDVIASQDGLNTLFYLDPPYLHETRTSRDEYNYEMSEAEHFMLLDKLARIKGKFLLSGYPSRLYAKAAEEHGWQVATKEIDNKASSKKTKDKKTECLWMNFESRRCVDS